MADFFREYILMGNSVQHNVTLAMFAAIMGMSIALTNEGFMARFGHGLVLVSPVYAILAYAMEPNRNTDMIRQAVANYGQGLTVGIPVIILIGLPTGLLAWAIMLHARER